MYYTKNDKILLDLRFGSHAQKIIFVCWAEKHPKRIFKRFLSHSRMLKVYNEIPSHLIKCLILSKINEQFAEGQTMNVVNLKKYCNLYKVNCFIRWRPDKVPLGMCLEWKDKHISVESTKMEGKHEPRALKKSSEK